MPVDDQIVTQDDGQQEVDESQQHTDDTPGDDAGNADGGDGSSRVAPTKQQRQDEYFLDVNDRTRYRTKEDAIQAYNEAGERISQLTPYAEIAERNGIPDPATLLDILNDYRQLRASAQKQVTKEDAGAAPAPDKRLDENPDLTEDDKKNIRYLQRLGLTQSEAIVKQMDQKIKDLQSGFDSRLTALEGSTRSVGQAQQDAVIEAGRSHLSQQLEAKGYSPDPEFTQAVEDSITNWIERTSLTPKGQVIPGSPLERFRRGGASMQSVVAEGMEKVLTVMNRARIQADGKSQVSKQQKVARTTKVMPKDSQSGVTDGKDGKRKNPIRPGAGGVFQDPKMHDRAFEIMQRTGGGAGASSDE